MSLLRTLWVLQPVAVQVVEVTALKLLLTVVGHRHRDEWVHDVKALLLRHHYYKITHYKAFHKIICTHRFENTGMDIEISAIFNISPIQKLI